MSTTPHISEYLSIKLQRLDVLLHREILRLKATYQLSLDEFRGLYISDEQVDRLVGHIANKNAPGQPAAAETDEPFDAQSLTYQAEALGAEITHSLPDDFPWSK